MKVLIDKREFQRVMNHTPFESRNEFIGAMALREAGGQKEKTNAEYLTDNLLGFNVRYTAMWQGLTSGCAWAKLVEVKL